MSTVFIIDLVIRMYLFVVCALAYCEMHESHSNEFRN